MGPQPEQFRLFPKDLFLTTKPALAKVYITAHNDLCPLFEWPAFWAGDRPDVIPIITGNICLRCYQTPENRHQRVRGHRALGRHMEQCRRKCQTAFLLEARLDYPNGSSTTIGTDESWKVLAHTAFIETKRDLFSPPCACMRLR